MNEIVGNLVFDSWQDPTPECRSKKTEDRHLIYEGDGVILDLLLRQSTDGSAIHVGGQLLLAKEDSGEISGKAVVLEQGRQRFTTHTNALGEFNFRAVPNGLLDVKIVLGKRRFKVSGLESPKPRMWQVVPSLIAGGY